MGFLKTIGLFLGLTVVSVGLAILVTWLVSLASAEAATYLSFFIGIICGIPSGIATTFIADNRGWI